MQDRSERQRVTGMDSLLPSDNQLVCFARPTSVTLIVFFSKFHLQTPPTPNPHLTPEPPARRLLHKCVSVRWGVFAQGTLGIFFSLFFFFDDTDYAICLDYTLGARNSDCEPSGRRTCVSAGPCVEGGGGRGGRSPR